MTDTFFTLCWRVAEHLGIARTGQATAQGGAGKNTTIDTVERVEASDYWNGGSIFIISAAGAAPEGEWARITDFDNASATITHVALQAITEIGDTYLVAKRRFPLQLLKQKVNEAIMDVGTILITDHATITTADSQTEHSLPIAANYDLREVYVARDTETDDYQWQKLYNWRVEKSATGVANQLILPQMDAGYAVKIVYAAQHPRLVNPSDKLDESIHANRIIYDAVVKCLLYRKQRIGDGDPTLNEQLNFFREQAENARVMFPVMKPERTPRLLIVGE